MHLFSSTQSPFGCKYLRSLSHLGPLYITLDSMRQIRLYTIRTDAHNQLRVREQRKLALLGDSLDSNWCSSISKESRSLFLSHPIPPRNLYLLPCNTKSACSTAATVMRRRRPSGSSLSRNVVSDIAFLTRLSASCHYLLKKEWKWPEVYLFLCWLQVASLLT